MKGTMRSEVTSRPLIKPTTPATAMAARTASTGMRCGELRTHSWPLGPRLST